MFGIDFGFFGTYLVMCVILLALILVFVVLHCCMAWTVRRESEQAYKDSMDLLKREQAKLRKKRKEK